MDARLYSWETDEVSSSKLWPRRRLDLCLSFPTFFVIRSWTTNLISICQGEKFWEVEDDRHEEEGEGVAKASLRTQAELKTVNRFLKFKTIYPPVIISQMDGYITWDELNVGLVNASLHVIHFLMPSWTYVLGDGMSSFVVSSVRSSYSHPDLLLITTTTPLFQITPVLNTGLSLSEPLELYKGYNAI